MFFKKKSNKNVDCMNCRSSVNEKYSFCPHCGYSLLDEEDEMKAFGMLGKSDNIDPFSQGIQANLGITDKIIQSIMQSFMKNIDTQFKETNKQQNMPEIQSFPNGIRIKIGLQPEMPKKVQKKTVKQTVTLTEEQIQKMSTFPRTTGKTNVRRLPDKVIYEISASGISSPQDIFISKIESGYEIKAIGKNKIYVNSLPVNLPIRGFSITDKGINVEFSLQ